MPNFFQSLFSSLSETDKEGAPVPMLDAQWDQAVADLSEAIQERADARAMAMMGLLVGAGRRGNGDGDQTLALGWFRRAAEGGNPMGQAALGVCLSRGFGVAEDKGEAARWLYEAAQQGSTLAAQFLADLTLSNPEVVGKHFSQAEFTELWRGAKRPRGRIH